MEFLVDLQVKDLKESRLYYRNYSTDSGIIDEGYGGQYVTYFPVEGGEVWYDIGAHIGSFSVYAAANGAKKVYAYEPLLSSFDILVKNIELNNMNEIILPYNVAVVDSEQEKVTLWSRPDNIGATSVYRMNIEQSIEGKALNVRGIDFEQNSCIKMDCEGAEGQIIPAIDLSKVKKLVFEYHHSVPGISILRYREIMRLVKVEFQNVRTTMYGDGTSMNWAWK